MKKLLSIILSAFILCTAAGAFAACGGEEQTQAPQPRDVVLADFETWAPSFQLMRLINGFGKVTRNSDEQFVRSGEYSAKLQPLGYYAQTTSPYLYFPTYSLRFGRDETDFRSAESISASMYCAQPQGEVTVGLIVSIASVYSAERVQETTFALKQGWNDIRYEIDLNILNIAYDVTLIQGVSFAFENAGSRDLADAPVYYMDDVVLHRAAENRELTDLVELGKYEICDFERLYQQYVISPSVDNPDCMPDIAVVTGEDGVAPSSGSKMLKIVTYPGSTREGSWPRITIPEKIMQRVFSSLTEEEKARGSVAFDVYNASDTPKIFYPEFYSEGGKDWDAHSFTSNPGRWVTFSVPISELNQRTVEMSGFWKIAWAEYLGEAQTFYFDNFRIEV